MSKDQVLGVVRHVLTGVGLLAVQKGYVDEASLTAAIGAIITLAGLAWSVLDKRA